MVHSEGWPTQLSSVMSEGKSGNRAPTGEQGRASVGTKTIAGKQAERSKKEGIGQLQKAPGIWGYTGVKNNQKKKKRKNPKYPHQLTSLVPFYKLKLFNVHKRRALSIFCLIIRTLHCIYGHNEMSSIPPCQGRIEIQGSLLCPPGTNTDLSIVVDSEERFYKKMSSLCGLQKSRKSYER